MRGHSLVELMEYDDSAADIVVFLVQVGLPHQTFIQYGSNVGFVMICTEYRVCSLHAVSAVARTR